jgi:predicted PurR-regulated permease PerM
MLIPPRKDRDSRQDMQDTDTGQVSPEWSSTTKRIVAISGILIGIFIIYISQSVLPFILVAAIVAFLLNPVVMFFNGKLRMPHWLAVMLTYFLLIVILLLVPLIATPAIINAATAIDIDIVDFLVRTSSSLQNSLQEIRYVEILRFQLDLSPVVDPALETLAGVVPQALIPSAQQIYNSIPSAVELATGVASTVVGTVLWALLAFLFTLIYAIYISLDFPQFGHTFWELVPYPYRAEYRQLWYQVRSVWAAFFRGQLILGLTVGVIVAIGDTALGVPGALVLGILAGLLEALPNIGPVLAAVPAVILALLQGSSVLSVSNLVFALIVVGFYFVVQQLENNIIVPRIIGQAVELPPIVVMAGVVVGASFGGILGAFMAVPVMATGRIVAQYAYNKLLDRPPFLHKMKLSAAEEQWDLTVPASPSSTSLARRREQALMDYSGDDEGEEPEELGPDRDRSEQESSLETYDR